MQKSFASRMLRYGLFFWVLLFALDVFAPSGAIAQPAKGTSAYTAARLKNHPPKNWIRHYLGDDRYKIAGGVWKVVSTELDRYYYPAWAPEMLRQPAGIVLGFASAQEAEDAGYLPSAYGAISSNSLYGLTSAEIAAARNRGGTVRGKRITLSDGASTVILPNGWKVMRIGTKTDQRGMTNYPLDMLTPDNGQSGIGFTFYTLPGNMNVEPFLKVEQESWLRKQMKKSGESGANIFDGSKLTSGKLGGLTGITIMPGPNANLPKGMSGIITMVGRKSKMYMMAAQLAPTDKMYGVVVNSFQPR